MLHVDGALQGEKCLNSKDIINKEESLTLLDAVWEPEQIPVIHCRGHQKEDGPQPGKPAGR